MMQLAIERLYEAVSTKFTLNYIDCQIFYLFVEFFHSHVI